MQKAFEPFRSLVKRPAQGLLKYDYLVPSGVYQEQWDWDAFFMGVALAAQDPKDAIYLRNVVLNFLDFARDDGFVPGCVTPKGADPRLHHVKPFLAQGAYLASTFLKDFSWVVSYFEKLKKVVFYREHHLWSNQYGLAVWFNSMESGVDNNVAALDFPDKTVIGADLNSYIYREYRAMTLIAKKIGKDGGGFVKSAEQIKKTIHKYLWNKKDSSYYNLDSRDGNHISRITFSNFIPLWAGIVPQEEGEKMIKRYLLNDQKLWGTYGARTLSMDDSSYNNANIIKPHSNWQGPVWPIANYIYMHALLRYGFQKEAIELAKKITKLVLSDIKETGGMHENYDAETGKPLAAPNFVSWNLLIGNMLGEATQNKNPFALN